MSATTERPRMSVPGSPCFAPLFMYQADTTIVNLANPSIRQTLGASGTELELAVRKATRAA